MSDDQPSAPYRLNLGAGQSAIPGFINIDLSERADLNLDLSVDTLPFPDSSVQTVFSSHTLEHISDYLFALSEIYRVLRHDGELLLSLPYVTLTEYHLVNPYHVHNFSEHSFDFFDPSLLKGSAAEENEITLRKVFVQFEYLWYFGMTPRMCRIWARKHLLNTVRAFDIGLVAIKEPNETVDAGPARAARLKQRLEQLSRERVPYALGGQESTGESTALAHSDGLWRRLISTADQRCPSAATAHGAFTRWRRHCEVRTE
jgi:SAM-dependent methyltransferase